MSGSLARSLGGLGDAINGTANVNFDAGTLTVDGVNNRVGVVSTTALGNSRLNVDLGITARTEAASGNAPYLQLFNGNAGTDLKTWRIGALSGGGFTVDTVNDAYSSANQRMSIDASGRVTIPGQPMFMGSPTTDYSGGSMPTGVIAFTALYNNGSHYNSGTSRFTAPVSGWYRTTWGGLQLNNTVTSLQVNGTRVYNGSHWSGTGPSYVNVTQTVLRTLNAGDYLTVEGWNGGGYYSAWYVWTVELVA